jgi:predicted nucleic acid-binding Zn ribbon protein
MRQLRQFGKQQSLRNAWETVIGPALAQEARAVRFRGGKLQVAVRSAPLLQELATFRKSELIEKLKQEEGFAGLVDIVFRTDVSGG